MKDLLELRNKVRKFSAERDWDKFHSPKNLAMAMSVEVAELVEHFQWLTEKESSMLDDETRHTIADEIADIQLYLVNLADKLNVDILDASYNKIIKNEIKYPVERVKGNSKKYDKY